MAWNMSADAKSPCMRKHTKVHPVQAKAWSMKYRRKIAMHAKAQANRNQRRGPGVVEGNCKIAYVRSVRKLEEI